MAESDDLKNLPAKVAGMNEPERVYSALERAPATRAPMIYGGGEDQAAKGEFSLRDILYVLFRHKWKIILTFLLLSAVTVLYVAMMPQMYESEARVLIRGERQGVIVDPTGEGNSFLKASRDGSSVRTEIGIIMSTMLAEQVVDKLGPEKVLGIMPGPRKPKPSWAAQLGASGWAMGALDAVESGYQTALAKLHLVKPKLTLRQMATGAIVGGLDVAPTMSESYVLRVSYRAPTPETARVVLDALVDAYQQQHIEIHKGPVSPAFFQGKIKDLKAQLDERENVLEAERKRLNISSLENQKAMLLTKFNTFDTALKENVMRINSLKAKIAQLGQLSAKRTKTGKDGKKVPSVPRNNPMLDKLRDRLFELKLKESDLASRFTDRNTELIDVRRQIKEIEGMISGESKSSGSVMSVIDDADPARSEMELQVALATAELESENAREAMLAKNLTSVQGELDKLMENEKEIKALEREVEILDNEYKQYLRGLQTADISATLDRDKISNVSIVQRATTATEPVKSQRKLLALLGFGIFMSLLAGVCWAFGLEFCDHSIKTNEEVERQLGLPVLVAIPYHKHHKPLLQEGNL